MKLILENWRSYLEEGWEEEARQQAAEAGEDTSPGLETVGDLRKVWAKRRSGELAKTTAAMGLSMNPILAGVLAAKDTASLLKKLYGAGDDFETQSGLDALNVDDKIELAFLRELIKEFEGAPDDERLEDFKTTERLQQFLASKFDSRTITKAAE